MLTFTVQVAPFEELRMWRKSRRNFYLLNCLIFLFVRMIFVKINFFLNRLNVQFSPSSLHKCPKRQWLEAPFIFNGLPSADIWLACINRNVFQALTLSVTFSRCFFCFSNSLSRTSQTSTQWLISAIFTCMSGFTHFKLLIRRSKTRNQNNKMLFVKVASQ